MGTALPVSINIEDVEDADLFQRAALAALTGYCAHSEIGLHADTEISALAWDTAEAFMEERADRAENKGDGEEMAHG
jgi:2C-methyl-D-erythritol 2,4-cyclodiphosphate synthase